jgi:hypothetical protein
VCACVRVRGDHEYEYKYEYESEYEWECEYSRKTDYDWCGWLVSRVSDDAIVVSRVIIGKAAKK